MDDLIPIVKLLVIVLGGGAVVVFCLAALFGVTRDVIRKWKANERPRLFVFLVWVVGWTWGLTYLIRVLISMSLGAIDDISSN